MANTHWPSQWESVSGDDAEGFVAVLARELPAGHVLEGRIERARAIARRRDQDDVLFALSDGRFASVHLTWGTNVLPWPMTSLFDDLGAWRNAQEEEDDDDA